MTLLKITKKSLLNRKATTMLTILSIALSVALLLGIERVRSGARKSFESTISGVDLIIGARSGSVNLLLYSVFRIGNATNNISYESFDTFSRHENVDWTIPISLGDSHRGYRVVGTNQNYFLHYQYGDDQPLAFAQGKAFEHLFDVVLGSEVAEKLEYNLLDKITLSHGSDEIGFQDHADKPFTIVGILKKTGTPVDKSVHVSLKAIEALHIDWQQGAPPMPGEEVSKDDVLAMDLNPADVTAFFVKLKSRMAIFNVQREVNDYEEEALMAILPGVTLRDLWLTVGFAEKTLFLVSLLVFFVSLIGMLISLLATLNERRREMAILRSVGAKKGFVFSLLIIETCVLAVIGILFGILILCFCLLAFKPILESKLGLTVGLLTPTINDFIYIASILLAAFIASIIPSWRAYKNSLADGLTVRN
ncbi:MAG TPA: ABC transporter permease [Oligoflexia bacterium]|nr:ABC transporter permease [Oligoflexia bacterium]HMR24660.1 ABC transporter permease [Oligoflexia bacterium]